MIKRQRKHSDLKPMALVILTGPPPPLDKEFKASRRMEVIFGRFGLSVGRCFGSKSAYRENNPGCIFIPNANVFCRTRGKVFWGDLDLARDKPALRRVAALLRCRLYVLWEFDGRFENADLRHQEVRRRALWNTSVAE